MTGVLIFHLHYIAHLTRRTMLSMHNAAVGWKRAACPVGRRVAGRVTTAGDGALEMFLQRCTMML